MNTSIIIFIIVFLGVVHSMLIYVIFSQERRYGKLLEENARIRSRQEAVKEMMDSLKPVRPEGPLTQEGIEDAVCKLGYVPEPDGDLVTFVTGGEHLCIDAERLPSVFVSKSFKIDGKEWDMELLMRAAHIMSDELMMVKAIFTEEGDGIRFLVAAIEANNAGFRENLPKYIRLIDNGRQRMDEIYRDLLSGKEACEKLREEDGDGRQPTGDPPGTEGRILS